MVVGEKVLYFLQNFWC